jgi:hypothetical protein
MHYDWLTFIIASLSIYRLARMIAEEDGPSFVFRRLRDRYTNDKRSFDVGLRCVYCIGFWVALPITMLLCVFGGWDIWLWPVWWLGLSGAAAKLHEYWKVR